MEFFEVVAARRSVRSFDDRPPPRRLVGRCLDAARLAPSGTNSQTWRFLVVRGAERRSLLAEAGYSQPCLREAPVITVLLGDRGFYKKRLRRAKELGDIGALTQDNLRLVESAYKKRPEDKGLQDAGIAANCMLAGEHYVLAAAALGLGCCWVRLFDAGKAAEILKIDTKTNFVVALLPTGYPAAGDIPPRPRYALSEIAWDESPDAPWNEDREDW